MNLLRKSLILTPFPVSPRGERLHRIGASFPRGGRMGRGCTFEKRILSSSILPIRAIIINIKTYIIIHIKIYIIFFCLLIPANIHAQANKVPPFRMIQSDGRAFVASQLPFDKHILIIYFSPDCEECQKLTSGLTGRIKDFQNVSIAMITYQHPETMRAYVKKNNLLNYNNIFVGTEYPSLFVRNYYNIMHFPYMALYDKNGNLVRKYTDKEIDLDDLLKRVGALK